MHAATSGRRLALAVSVFLAGWFSAGPLAPAAGQEAAKAMPPDAFLLLTVGNVNAAREKLKKTSLYALYKAPAMQPFVGPTEKKVRALIDEKLKEAWKEVGLEKPPTDLPTPQGQVALAVRMATKTVKIPKYELSAEDGRPKITGFREIKQPAPQIVLLAEMGKNLQAAKDLVARLAEKAVDKGWKRDRQAIRGVQIETLTPPAPKRPGGPGGTRDAVCYGFKEATLVFGSAAELVKEVLVRRSGADVPTLADNADLKNTIKALGGPGDLCFYLNIKALIDFAKTAGGPEEAEKTAQIIRALGVANVPALAATVSIAPGGMEDMRLKALLSIRGQRTGIPAVITPASASTKPNPMLTKGLASFFVANYDLGRMYDEIVKIVQAAAGQDIGMLVKGMMAITGGQGENARPPVDLRKEVLGQLAPPLIVLSRIEKPYTDPNAARMMLAIGVRDGGILDAALGRMHDVFLARGNKQLRRVLLNRTIYLFPPGVSITPPMPGMRRRAPAGGQLALAVAGTHFVFGSVGSVEQAIRNLRRTGVQSISADPMYQYASRHLPARAGIVTYENAQVGAEMLWAQLKDAARKAANPAGDPAVGAAAPAPTSPMALLVPMLKDYCDFNALPEFQTVKKHFGVTIGHVVSRRDGIYAEWVGLKPPKTP